MPCCCLLAAGAGDHVEAAVAGIERDLGPAASVGGGIPGTISPASGLVKNANSTWLIGKPLHGLHEEITPPVA